MASSTKPLYASSRASRQITSAFSRRFILRYISLFLLCIAVAAVGASFACGGPQGIEYSIQMAIFSSGFWGLAIFWDLFVVIFECARGYALPPGANVGMDLVIWMAAIVANTFVFATLWQAGFDVWWMQELGLNGQTPAQAMVTSTLACTAGVVGSLAMLLHFGIFVAACREESQRRRGLKLVALVANGSEHSISSIDETGVRRSDDEKGDIEKNAAKLDLVEKS